MYHVIDGREQVQVVSALEELAAKTLKARVRAFIAEVNASIPVYHIPHHVMGK